MSGQTNEGTIQIKLTTSRILDPEKLKDFAKHREEAHKEISKLCSGLYEFHMSIPVQSYDSDVILSQVLSDQDEMSREIYRLRAVLRALYTNYFGEMPKSAEELIASSFWQSAEVQDI